MEHKYIESKMDQLINHSIEYIMSFQLLQHGPCIAIYTIEISLSPQ